MPHPKARRPRESCPADPVPAWQSRGVSALRSISLKLPLHGKAAKPVSAPAWKLAQKARQSFLSRDALLMPSKSPVLLERGEQHCPDRAQIRAETRPQGGWGLRGAQHTGLPRGQRASLCTALGSLHHVGGNPSPGLGGLWAEEAPSPYPQQKVTAAHAVSECRGHEGYMATLPDAAPAAWTDTPPSTPAPEEEARQDSAQGSDPEMCGNKYLNPTPRQRCLLKMQVMPSIQNI